MSSIEKIIGVLDATSNTGELNFSLIPNGLGNPNLVAANSIMAMFNVFDIDIVYKVAKDIERYNYRSEEELAKIVGSIAAGVKKTKNDAILGIVGGLLASKPAGPVAPAVDNRTPLEKYFEYLKSWPILDGFNDAINVIDSFGANIDSFDITLLHAVYDCPPYEGYATVFYYDYRDEKYYENHGSHCSCHGLENQWDPTEINFKELENRIWNGSFTGVDTFKYKYKDFLGLE
jgi:hypothetical protein